MKTGDIIAVVGVLGVLGLVYSTRQAPPAPPPGGGGTAPGGTAAPGGGGGGSETPDGAVTPVANNIGCTQIATGALPGTALAQAQALLALSPAATDPRNQATYASVLAMRELANGIAYCGSALPGPWQLRDEWVAKLRARADFIERNVPSPSSVVAAYQSWITLATTGVPPEVTPADVSRAHESYVALFQAAYPGKTVPVGTTPPPGA